ncbi:MAG: acylphosphatase [Thermoanaerobaculaceae bacterium]|nr:acylphosphatase [Thermoanaerobaculaceae bacterium]
MTSRRYVVAGRVQGVGFRYFVLREAQALGLCGWVRNLPSGEVEVLAAGEEVQLAALEGRLWQGPPHARVREVRTGEGEAVNWDDFRVLPTPW